MTTSLECPRCRCARWIPLKAVFAYRRNWLGRWVKVRTHDVIGCDKCRRVYELEAGGALLMIEDAPAEARKEAAERDRERDEDEMPRHALADAIRRPEV